VCCHTCRRARSDASNDAGSLTCHSIATVSYPFPPSLAMLCRCQQCQQGFAVETGAAASHEDDLNVLGERSLLEIVGVIGCRPPQICLPVSDITLPPHRLHRHPFAHLHSWLHLTASVAVRCTVVRATCKGKRVPIFTDSIQLDVAACCAGSAGESCMLSARCREEWGPVRRIRGEAQGV
jgi:hypothetical protein